MFHDTLPGSSIHLAVEDYDRKFAAIHKTAIELFDEAINALGEERSSKSSLVINTLPSQHRKEVVSLGDGKLGVADIDAHALCGKAEKYDPCESDSVTGMLRHVQQDQTDEAVHRKGDSIKMSNASLDVIITKGRITSLFDKVEK